MSPPGAQPSCSTEKLEDSPLLAGPQAEWDAAQLQPACVSVQTSTHLENTVL